MAFARLLAATPARGGSRTSSLRADTAADLGEVSDKMRAKLDVLIGEATADCYGDSE